ncbi:polymer-forming cytoskeletal protein [Brachyspira sp. G79]|uniref:bactofilin family protein n=1 Tax=Brachyspira sp. G79 TaxID=1358104 RepID=UPI000BBC6260|nr:polymer-forming cytoskeletal protein [Brachyspira sp. G79]PCG20924.1 cell shape determination protein [Brachyspira sp. G79]
MAKRDMINSVIGDGSSFKGTFIVKGSFQIDGKFEGELKIDGHLVIGPNGKVKTSTIITESITIAGTLIGNIDARREVILIETGRVLGNIEAPKIDVGEGAVIQGEMTITGGQKKDISKVVEESFTGVKMEDNSFDNANNSTSVNLENNNNIENNTSSAENNSFDSNSQNSSSIF